MNSYRSLKTNLSYKELNDKEAVYVGSEVRTGSVAGERIRLIMISLRELQAQD